MIGISDDGTPVGRPPQLAWTPTFVVFLAYIFIIVTYRVNIATVVMAVALLTMFLEREPVRVPTFLWLFAAWMAWAGVGYAASSYPDHVWPSLIEQGKVLLVTLVAVNAIRTTAQVRFFMLFVLLSYLLFPVRSTLVNYVVGYTRFGRAVGPFLYQNSNDLAALTILVLGPALALGTSGSRRSLLRWIGLACAIPLVVTIVLTQSRGAFLALGGMALPSGIALARHRPRVAAGFAALVGLTLYLAPAGLWDRLAGLRKAASVATIGEMDPEGSARERFAVLRTAVRIVADHPVLGVGLGAYEQANARYSPAVGQRDTHNTYLNVAAETGLPGLVLFLGLVTSVLRGARHARRAWRGQAEAVRWLQYGFIGYLIAGMFASFSKLTFPYIFLGLLWSASQAMQAQRSPANSSERLPMHPDHAMT
jgi:O-antigen ligase